MFESAPRKPLKIGIISLGCPKALVDSERILTKLHAEGYEIAGSHEGADAVTVTGCMGIDEGSIRGIHSDVLAVSGPQQYEAVIEAVHDALSPAHDPFLDQVPSDGLHLTSRHYTYLKIPVHVRGVAPQSVVMSTKVFCNALETN